MTTPYRGDLPWVDERTILLVRHGSHAYGLAVDTSDEDYKGIAIPPPSILFGMGRAFEQAESSSPDVVIYDLRKFLRLAVECNPNVIEVLWVDDRDRLLCTKLGEQVVAARHLFLSRRARQTFAGYALGQLKRIKTHRRWLTHPPKGSPTRAEFGLPERTVIPKDQLAAAQAAIRRQLEKWQLDDLDELSPAARIALQNNLAELYVASGLTDDARHRAAATALGFDANFLLLLDQERRYTARQHEWEQFCDWQKTRNPARAALEAQHGYDTKHAMHLVRLLRMCREILAQGSVAVRRPDRDELLAIRNGAWSYERLIEWAEEQDGALAELARLSPLPAAADENSVDRLCVDLIEQSLTYG